MALKRRPQQPPVDPAAAPDLMPVLARGRHKDPTRGACFLEYTSLLAGEAFSDEPACVDRELAAILRQANDRLTDADRPHLVPLLGRAVGLVVPPPSTVAGWVPQPGMTADQVEARLASFAGRTVTLHRRVSARFMAALDVVPDPAVLRRFDGGRDLRQLFWFLMEGPTYPATSAAWVDRLIRRLVLLHECFECELGRGPAVQPAETWTSPAAAAPAMSPAGR
jgi:hypothetical protein